MSVGLKFTQLIYDFLDVGKAPQFSDCIFVLAGQQDRKVYGLKMWRLGFAYQLILSVGRFEWRRFYELGLESDGGLESLVKQTPPKKRHFLVRMDRQDVTCCPVQIGYFGTLSESRALAQYLRGLSVRSLLVVSSPVHLRRSALVFRRAFRKSGIRLTFVATPEKISFNSSGSRAAVWLEFFKYLIYRLFAFALPGAKSRLRQRP
jgi:uncharacterized SAM-binding protein YcdF (DUF218 family)